ncbi:hypothetical protein AM500_12335 [Bacillus sp. FJAT-18017]|uniref:hypothetical protein n=1 Tax=Bacillus sp. FJAT-18017 TaxID=1705566 RepID=UPI0006AF60A5|nr:hypothetical protein [Bacillus sp. FJAT-18017]ALC90486.1 hypothetical protein AM500_12335 [Bacillus sp. FJAT-18017]
MKKYILPAVILLISILFINQVTEPPKKETPAASATKPDNLPSIMSNSGSEEVFLLEKEGADLRSISKEKLASAMEQAETISVMPWERLAITYPIYPSKVTFTEYAPEEGMMIDYEQEDDLYIIPAAPGIRGLIITAEWAQGGKATYFAKIDVQSIYSYQEMISPNPEIFSVIAFSETENHPEIPPSIDGIYSVQMVTGSQEELQRDFPDLGLAALPAFFVFQTSDMIFETHKYDQLISFLTKKEVLVYEGESENWKITLTVEQKLGNGSFETQLSYKGKSGDKFGQFETTVNGQSWSAGEGGHQLDENNHVTSINTINWAISKTEKVNYIVKWDGKEETIPLSLKEDHK